MENRIYKVAIIDDEGIVHDICTAAVGDLENEDVDHLLTPSELSSPRIRGMDEAEIGSDVFKTIAGLSNLRY